MNYTERMRALFTEWLDAGQPTDLHADLRKFISDRMVKVLDMYKEFPIERAQDMAVAGVACGLGTCYRTSRVLCGIVGWEAA